MLLIHTMRASQVSLNMKRKGTNGSKDTWADLPKKGLRLGFVAIQSL